MAARLQLISNAPQLNLDSRRFSLYVRGTVWMTALAGNLNLIAAGFLTGGAAVFTLGSAGARDVGAFLVVCFLSWDAGKPCRNSCFF